MNEEKHIAKLMNTLDLTREQALELIADDKAVDRMTKMSEIKGDMTAEQIKASKKYAQADRKKKEEIKKPTVYNFDTTEKVRKTDTQKVSILDKVAELLQAENCTEIVRTKEGQLDFLQGGRKMRIVLSAPRK